MWNIFYKTWVQFPVCLVLIKLDKFMNKKLHYFFKYQTIEKCDNFLVQNVFARPLWSSLLFKCFLPCVTDVSLDYCERVRGKKKIGGERKKPAGCPWTDHRARAVVLPAKGRLLGWLAAEYTNLWVRDLASAWFGSTELIFLSRVPEFYKSYSPIIISTLASVS